MDVKEIRRIIFWTVFAIVVAVIIGLYVFGERSEAADYTVRCTPPTHHAPCDAKALTGCGAPLSQGDIAGYEWRDGDGPVDSRGVTPVCEFVMINWPDGTYPISARTVMKDGRRSVWSVPKDIVLAPKQIAPPLPPVLQ